ISQGDAFSAHAILAGTGTGTITGQWLWDGSVSEQFAVNMVGGERVLLDTRGTLPNLWLGVHRLEVGIPAPPLLPSRAIGVVINPGDWRSARLLRPAWGAAVSETAQPTLGWLPVPGASHYQVGFSAEPYFNRISSWYDASDTEWQVPAQVWKDLPLGELYWTMRVVEGSGEIHAPLPMRRLIKLPESALAARTNSDSALEWQSLTDNVLYRVTVSRNADGTGVVRRFLTRDAHTDISSLRSALTQGRTCYWQVEAFSANGSFLVAGPRQPLGASQASRRSQRRRRDRYDVASLVPAGPPQLSARIAMRSPADGARIKESKPRFVIELNGKVT